MIINYFPIFQNIVHTFISKLLAFQFAFLIIIHIVYILWLLIIFQFSKILFILLYLSF